MATKWRHYLFTICLFISRNEKIFVRNPLKKLVPPLVMAKFEQILWERFENILKQSFERHKNSE